MRDKKRKGYVERGFFETGTRFDFPTAGDTIGDTEKLDLILSEQPILGYDAAMAGTRATKGRVIAVVAGIGVVAVLTVAATRWEQIATRYYLHRLRANPEYAWQLVEKGVERPAVDKALRLFLAEPRGRDWFVGQLWTHVIAPLVQLAQEAGQKVETGIVIDEGREMTGMYWRYEHGEAYTHLTPQDSGLARKCFALAGLLTCRRTPVPGKAEWLVTGKESENSGFEALIRDRRFFEEVAREAGFSTIPKNLDLFCVVETAEAAKVNRASKQSE